MSVPAAVRDLADQCIFLLDGVPRGNVDSLEDGNHRYMPLRVFCP
jgi:hypothetical protein